MMFNERQEKMAGLIGTEIGVSEWFLLDQARVDAFADVTEDHQFIHVDPQAAAATEFGGTIAHGFLTLSLLSRMYEQAVIKPAGALMSINYGFERVRFLTPVPTGKRVRGRFSLASIGERQPGNWQYIHAVTIEIEGASKPALVADWITLIRLPAEADPFA